MPDPHTPIRASPRLTLESLLCAPSPDPLFPPTFSTPQPSPSNPRFNPDDLLISPPSATTPDLRRKLFSASDPLLSALPNSILRRRPSNFPLSPSPISKFQSQSTPQPTPNSHLQYTPQQQTTNLQSNFSQSEPQSELQSELQSEPHSHSHLHLHSHLLSQQLPDVPSSPHPTRTKCNCKASRCLKLYCPCFASSGVCAPTCTCQNCQNTSDTYQAVQQARSAVLSRDPRAFEPRVRAAVAARDIHAKGCNCRKGCSKNYCVCRELRVACGPRCTCSGPNGCQNGKNVVAAPARISLERGRKRKPMEQLTPCSPLPPLSAAFSPSFPPLDALSPTLKLPDDPFDDFADVIADSNDPLISPGDVNCRHHHSPLMPRVNRRISLDDDPLPELDQTTNRDIKLPETSDSNLSNTTPDAMKPHAIEFAASPTTGAKSGSTTSRLRSALSSVVRADKMDKRTRPRLPRILRVKMGTGRALKRFNI